MSICVWLSMRRPLSAANLQVHYEETPEIPPPDTNVETWKKVTLFKLERFHG